MEIQIENPDEPKGDKNGIPGFSSMEENCISGRSCVNGGICKATALLPDRSVVEGICICPLGFSGNFCDESKQFSRINLVNTKCIIKKDD